MQILDVMGEDLLSGLGNEKQKITLNTYGHD